MPLCPVGCRVKMLSGPDTRRHGARRRAREARGRAKTRVSFNNLDGFGSILKIKHSYGSKIIFS
jgi:hypothetical protein